MGEKKNTLIINLYGGPGTGKSTGAAYIFSQLKLDGIDAEYISEFAKDKVWEENSEVFKNQFYITGKQSFKISRCFGKVDIIVTDSPLRMGSVYADTPELKKAIEAEADKYKDNELNIFLERVKDYNPNGRHQTEDEAKAIDKQILDMLIALDIDYRVFDGSQDGYDAIVRYVHKILTTGTFSEN